jgi:tRNA dimethylallyltransferase
LVAGDDVTDAPRSAIDVVPVICGPTAAGKSAIALRLAEVAPITIISADSRQIYRGFDIGTAKPSAAEQALVPHVGLDVADPAERWSAWRWAVFARHAIAEARNQGRQPVVVGGTGFYVRALVSPLASVPPLDEARRTELAGWLDARSPEQLRAWCARLDAPRAQLGPVQWRRAIEVALLTGTPLSVWHARHAGHDAPLAVRYLVVDPGESLATRIASRVEQMAQDGWVAEVAGLTGRVPPQAPAWQSTGYDVMREHVEGRRTLRDALTQITIATRQYAKRQRTWYRHQLHEGPVTRLSPTAPDAWDHVLAWWRALTEDGA